MENLTAGIDSQVVIMGFIICLARIIDVTMGTMRTISIVRGRTAMAFFLGFVEVSIWLVVISAVVGQIREHPFLGFCYALGFSTGNVVGIRLEQRLARGYAALRVISASSGFEMARRLRECGFTVTTFSGQGRTGEVLLVYMVLERRRLGQAIRIVKEIEPEAFYITEQPGSVSKLFRPEGPPSTGWRAIPKKK